MWTAVVLMILVAVDASVMVSFITRFTEEAFATMISIIFLIKAVEELLGISHRFPMVADPLVSSSYHERPEPAIIHSALIFSP